VSWRPESEKQQQLEGKKSSRSWRDPKKMEYGGLTLRGTLETRNQKPFKRGFGEAGTKHSRYPEHLIKGGEGTTEGKVTKSQGGKSTASDGRKIWERKRLGKTK